MCGALRVLLDLAEVNASSIIGLEPILGFGITSTGVGYRLPVQNYNCLLLNNLTIL